MMSINSRPASNRAPPSSKRKASPQSLIGAAGLAATAAGCAFAIYTSLFAGTTRVGVLVAQQTADGISFSSRFEAIASDRVAGLSVAPPKQSRTAALLDPAFALGAAQEGFVAPPPRPMDVAASVASRDAAKPSVVAALAPPSAPAVPLPTSRPQDTRIPSKQAATDHQSLVQRARATILAQAKNSATASIFDKLFGREAPGPVLAYAGSDGGVLSDGSDAAASPFDRYTAVYDITAKTVYMPSGAKLEAHSGLGSKMDDPRYVHVRMQGATPPHIYDLKMREALFHGVEAIRLTPVGGEAAIHNRNGLLAHTYMLGPRGDSNGCVSFRNYEAFLRAFKNGEVKRLVVVAKAD